MKKPKLHPGAKMLPKPIEKKIGGWVKMAFDASIEVFGLTWFRVKDGMGGDGKREDWVADLPEICLSVHDYQWNGSDFGPDHGSFVGAMKEEMESSQISAIQRAKEFRAKASDAERAADLLSEALRKARTV